ncbi:sulfatase-like hydrolase/transferase [Geminicoccus roseus]|uniref:sulfatase-like hydrolase/transferase n=1 Tax=Geminicoccus roseus TaxID=404900 RepID=UPI0004202507|nr:sulfatase-like hydrolase/transferase [Geminicoccus roseus]
MSGRPNILFVTVDQWPGHLLGIEGHPVVETPTLDQLARNGTRFTRAYAECPICIPARRSIMTGTDPRTHGDRVFQPDLPMPDLPTLAGSFRNAGYQATAVGKLHVYPPRDRIGFDEVILSEEGRPHLGTVDDYDQFLADKGYPGQQYLHGMSNNGYVWRSWHLPEDCHVTNWATMAMCRTIKRRDPTRPALWHLSYTHPHPPLVPLASYVERYARRAMDEPVMGDWATEEADLPVALQIVRGFWPNLSPDALADVKRAFYALCTHIDHQLRIVIGTLREEGILDDTIILFTSDHGDLLGDHGLYAKRYLYEGSARVPMILIDRAKQPRLGQGMVDDRLVGLQDVMPTLLDLAGIDIPASCTGRSMLDPIPRRHLYAEALEGQKATRMVTDGRHKLIWYPAGNHLQLFDLELDPRELQDRKDDPGYAAVRDQLEQALVGALHGGDEAWVRDGRLEGFPAAPIAAVTDRGLSGQRGLHYPQPPMTDPGLVVGTP